ncbi:hypothetical protein [Leucobacter tenebrionis]|uniref:hypothetical protein n=1 Tax=Leucobacter tenebrionis TaxID=2873270 RepID=UPI001CA7AEDF|nr:hypothetical protein [Leucobacter tenebrionis]QZY52272.1 hypothetical protein KVY00_02025 [Leucobacter tenebrionis]
MSDEGVPEFDWNDVEIPDDVWVRFGDGSGDELYRTCGECGADCRPEPTGADGLGARIAFVCPEHGVHSVVDPFEHLR